MCYHVAANLTPSDVTVFQTPFSAFYVGGENGGDVTIVTYSGETVLFSDVPPGTIIPVKFNQLKATGTTATNIVGLNH